MLLELIFLFSMLIFYLMFSFSQGILCCVVNVDDVKQGNIAESNKSNASI